MRFSFIIALFVIAQLSDFFLFVPMINGEIFILFSARRKFPRIVFRKIMPRVAVVVLGDIGHSPRMQYHCISLANHNIDVDFIGYRGSIPHKRVTENSRINIRYLPSSPSVPSTFGLIFKLIWQIFTMLYVLLARLEKPDVILMQNPPGLPALFICWLVAKIRRSRLIIDWHNYTWSIFSLRYKRRNFFVQLVEWFEFTMGKLADNGFCVTEAMKKDLNKRGIRVVTHYDRPNTMFRPLNDKEKLNFLEKLSAEMTEFKDLTFTAMLISSTSWTPDEDFGVLLSALKMYDDEPNENLPRLLVVVTGKGPLKDHYVENTQRLSNLCHLFK